MWGFLSPLARRADGERAEAYVAVVPDGSEAVFLEEAAGGAVVERDERGRPGGAPVP